MQSRLVPEKCIACGLCQVYAPNIFDYDDHGIVLFKDEPHARQQFIPENERENVLKAYRKCPTRAIEISKMSAKLFSTHFLSIFSSQASVCSSIETNCNCPSFNGSLTK